MNIVIVESESKADLFRKILGSDYQVIASGGNVRELLTGSNSVNTENQFEQNWQVLPKQQKILHEITVAINPADGIIIATNPDREGEANSWHILETLHNWNALAGKLVQRVAVSSLTKEDILNAFSAPRKLAAPLIDSIRAQCAIDHLFNLKLNAILSQKLPGFKITNLEQSTLLKLICDRETEIEQSNPISYWNLKISHLNNDDPNFNFLLTTLDGQQFNPQAITSKEQAETLKNFLQHAEFQVKPTFEETKQILPPAPYNTTTLIIDAARLLGFSPTKTIQYATDLYEGITLSTGVSGLITYFATESEKIKDQTILDIRQFIQKHFGTSYLPDSSFEYPSHEKNGYETHEAIRPTSMQILPETVASSLSAELTSLYKLIWNRTVASQMSPLLKLQKTAEFDAISSDQSAKLLTTYTNLQFEGFQKIYPESGELASASDSSIPNNLELSKQLAISIELLESKPPKRFNEAALIEKANQLGIGTPLKNAYIIQSLRSNGYIKIEQQELIPTDKGRIFYTFINSFCPKLADSDFTASIKKNLDMISDGKLSYHDYLTAFWEEFSNIISEVQAANSRDIIETLNNNLSPLVFPGKADGIDPRSCPKCGNGELSLKFSRVGTYVTCSNASVCRYTRQLGYVETNFSSNTSKDSTKILGTDTTSGLEVSIRDGRYGIFVQLGIGSNPKRVSLPPNWGFENVDLETAINFLALPREVGLHPDSGYPIHAGIGRFGPFVLHNNIYSKLNSVRDAFTIDLTGAVQAITRNTAKNSKLSSLNDKSQKLGQHSKGGPIFLIKGRTGPFLKYQNLNIKLPKELNPNSLTLDQAIQLIDQQRETV